LPIGSLLAYGGFNVLFSCLDAASIVLIYTALLLEHRVLLVSRDPHRASFAVIAASVLILPFVGCTSIMPVIPCTARFLPLTDSPVPYLFGSTVPHDSADFIVDLDRGEIAKMEEMPVIPRRDHLMERIEAILAGQTQVPEKFVKSLFGKKRNPVYQSFVAGLDQAIFPRALRHGVCLKYILSEAGLEGLLHAFNFHVAPELERSATLCLVTDSTDGTDNVTILNSELFYDMKPEDEKPFWDEFMMTQMFDQYVNDVADAHARERNHRRTHSGPE
jgi:hypothetical protein